ncbi:hypothetical protein KEM48_012191 [Puccinia striiformis f. sp. tritici PST-130]|nr:hypothetical protein KEM48_012191 [Puccinia striiformis f. sp. tritici PST-130]
MSGTENERQGHDEHARLLIPLAPLFLPTAYLGSTPSTVLHLLISLIFGRTSTSSDKPPVSESSISDKLLTRFPDAEVRVEDVSGGCGSFFVVQVIDKSFHGLSTLKQHQLINRTLAEEIDIIHGLQIQTRSPPS